jgi:hypothetical protein
VRIRRLLFLLAPTLLGGATPVHAALGPAPKCLPLETTRGTTETVDVKPPIAELSEPVPNYDAEDRDYLIRTIVFEAADEPDEGKAAVAYVILNRMRSGRWGDNVKDVVTRPWQFEPWITRRREMEKLAPDDARYQSAARIADAVLTGEMPDPTAGATHFLNPTIVRQRRGGFLAIMGAVRDRLSVGIPSTRPMRAAGWRWHDPSPHWEIPFFHAHARRRP